MSNKVLLRIRNDLKNNVDKKYYQQSFKFFKEEIKCFGVRAKITDALAKKYFFEIKDLSKKEIFNLCEELLKAGTNEEEKIAFDWAYRLKRQFAPGDFLVFEKWLKKYVSNWGSCDDFCTHAFGDLLLQYPKFLSRVQKWARSKNRWERRAAAVILIFGVRQGKFLAEIFKTSSVLLKDEDDLVRKGYGWALKEASNVFSKEVFAYVMKNRKQMPRVALRYAVEKMPVEWKRETMK
ncbi:MAG: DNA alkylation repair protein [Candidatus Uhrbacteria bacterium]